MARALFLGSRLRAWKGVPLSPHHRGGEGGTSTSTSLAAWGSVCARDGDARRGVSDRVDSHEHDAGKGFASMNCSVRRAPGRSSWTRITSETGVWRLRGRCGPRGRRAGKCRRRCAQRQERAMPCACVPERVRALRATRLPLEDFTSEELATAINRGGSVAVDASTAPRQPRHTGKKSGPWHVRREREERKVRRKVRRVSSPVPSDRGGRARWPRSCAAGAAVGRLVRQHGRRAKRRHEERLAGRSARRTAGWRGLRFEVPGIAESRLAQRRVASMAACCGRVQRVAG